MLPMSSRMFTVPLVLEEQRNWVRICSRCHWSWKSRRNGDSVYGIHILLEYTRRNGFITCKQRLLESYRRKGFLILGNKEMFLILFHRLLESNRRNGLNKCIEG